MKGSLLVLLLLAATSAEAGTNPPACVAEFRDILLKDTKVGTRYQVSLGRIEGRNVLSFVAKKSEKKDTIERAVELIDQHLLAPKCAIALDDVFFLLPHGYSYTLKAADIATLKDLRTNRALWRAGLWMRVRRTDVQ